jgi:hypothetical protein
LFLQADTAWSFVRGDDSARQFAPRSDWLAAHADRSVRVVLSGTLTHQIVVSDPALPIEDTQSLLSWARHQFVHYHGPSAERWTLAPWVTRSQRGASAAHGIDLDALVRVAEAQRVRVRAVQPWWAVALQAATVEAPTLALAPEAELWLVEAMHVTRVVCHAGRIEKIEQHWLERADAAELATLMRSCGSGVRARWVLGYGLEANGLETLPARRLGRLDASHPAPRWLGV